MYVPALSVSSLSIFFLCRNNHISRHTYRTALSNSKDTPGFSITRHCTCTHQSWVMKERTRGREKYESYQSGTDVSTESSECSDSVGWILSSTIRWFRETLSYHLTMKQIKQCRTHHHHPIFFFFLLFFPLFLLFSLSLYENVIDMMMLNIYSH